MAAHPKGKNCPTDMIFSKKHGKCIQPNLEVVDGAEYPERRNKSASNLDFTKSPLGMIQGVKNVFKEYEKKVR